MSCETNQQGLNSGYDSYMQSARPDNPEVADTMDGLFKDRNGNVRMPSSAEVNEVVSHPGSGVCHACAQDPTTQPRGNFGSDPGYTVSLKNYPRPRRGCFDPGTVSKSEADRLIASQGLTTDGAKENERQAMAAAIKRVQQLEGGPLREGMGPGGNYPFKFVDANGSAQRAGYILIGRNTASKGHTHNHGNSVAQHAHEWAHLIGNQGAYAEFRRFMGGGRYGSKDYCMVSNYADNNANEQFAEVFTAFVTEPRILLNNSRTPENCRRVFQFFKDHFFKKGDRVANCL